MGLVKGPFSKTEWENMLDLRAVLNDTAGDDRFLDTRQYCRKMLKLGFGKESSDSDPI